MSYGVFVTVCACLSVTTAAMHVICLVIMNIFVATKGQQPTIFFCLVSSFQANSSRTHHSFCRKNINYSQKQLGTAAFIKLHLKGK